jgi:ABC-type dipeptide/oligopeptide/nickel transport system ATPase component
VDRQEAWSKAVEMLQMVQIPSPDMRVHEYPHQLSGGMRQRAMIAMALSCRPRLLLADEPTTALDVTIQAQIVDLMERLKEEFETSIVLITHNLGLIAEMAKRVLVMYMGKVVEEAPVGDLFQEPLHPYTQGLLESIPWIGKQNGETLRDSGF